MHDELQDDSGSEAGPPPTSSNKRKASYSTNGGSDKKKRSRVSFSCSECHRRKQKCDRQQPCGHCIARRVPELCHAYQPGKGEGDLHVRLARVEHILELALPQYYGGKANTTASSSPAPRASLSKMDRLQSMDPDASMPSTPSDSVRDDEIVNPIGNLQDNTRLYVGAEALGNVNSAPILEKFHGTQAPPVDEAQAAAEKLHSLVQDYGVQPHKLEELFRELPPKSYSDELVDYFFKSINYTRHPIFEPHFRASYELLMAKDHRVQPIDMRFLPLLFIVLATAARLAPEHLVGNVTQRISTSLRYYWSSRRSLMLAGAIGESLELVITRLLTSRLLTAERRIAEGWNILGTAIRTALALGLHRDGAKLGLDPFQTEYRRRIWSYLYHADRSQGLVLGRPTCVQDEFCDVEPPTNCDDRYWTGPTIAIPKALPLTEPTQLTAVVLRHRFARIVGHIVRHFQLVKPTHYSDVIALDQEVQDFVKSLPRHFGATHPDTSLDESHPFIPPHRFLIVSEVFFVRISLHRPYMLRNLNSERFAFSRKACFDAALSDFELRQHFKKNTHPDVIRCLGGAYREFQSAMISGISLALDPHGRDAALMHKVLDTFLKEHQPTGGDVDETTRRELKIIQLLKTKAVHVANGQPLESPPDSKLDLPDERVSAIRTVTVPTPRPPRPGSEDVSPASMSPLQRQALGSSSSNSAWDAPMVIDNPIGAAGIDLSMPPPHRNGRVVTADDDLAAINSSGASTGSPVDEGHNSVPQRLLDHWVNNSAQMIDSVGSGFFGLNALDQGQSWYGNAGDVNTNSVLMASALSMPTVNSSEFAYNLPRTESADLVRASSSGLGDPSAVDWSYWDSLVDHIRAAGASQ